MMIWIGSEPFRAWTSLKRAFWGTAFWSLLPEKGTKFVWCYIKLDRQLAMSQSCKCSLYTQARDE